MALSETLELQRGAQRFLRAAMKKPMLAADHERELARAWRDDRDEHALHELTMAYMRLVVAMASRFRHYGLPLSDLVQEGNVGLMQAAMRFEPDREVRFSTYASWWIRSAMQDFVLRNWSIVRTGDHVGAEGIVLQSPPLACAHRRCRRRGDERRSDVEGGKGAARA
jgi:RNA polymerase sigma-32 factor